MESLSIGILAHNEADVIASTIASLSRQTILLPSTIASLGLANVEIYVVPNGCSDATAAVAEQALARIRHDKVTVSVSTQSEPGKSRAWNIFVHELSSPKASILALMDADIDFASSDVIEKLLRRLLAGQHISVTTDVPIKDFRANETLSTSNRLSLAASRQRIEDHAICGQLYCARAEALRSIWMPPYLPVEDGFLAAMIQTAGFTRQPVKDSVARVYEVSHYYRSYKGISGFLEHESRIIVGSIINTWLFADLWNAGRAGHVGDYIRRRNEEDVDWVEKVASDARSQRGYWLIPAHFVFWRLTPLRSEPILRALTRAPIAIATTIAAFFACIKANRILRGGAVTKFW